MSHKIVEIDGKDIHYGETVSVDHTITTFIVQIRHLNFLSPETIKDLIEKKHEVVSIEDVGSVSYVRVGISDFD